MVPPMNAAGAVDAEQVARADLAPFGGARVLDVGEHVSVVYREGIQPPAEMNVRARALGAAPQYAFERDLRHVVGQFRRGPIGIRAG
jgi:hypothetical protein